MGWSAEKSWAKPFRQGYREELLKFKILPPERPQRKAELPNYWLSTTVRRLRGRGEYSAFFGARNCALRCVIFAGRPPTAR
jgi:hypothetical protein